MPSAQHFPAVVVGAGLSGLTCAYYLRKSGIEPLILENSSSAGGVICSQRDGAHLLELGPQSFAGTPSILDLCRDLQISGQLLEAPHSAPRFVLLRGKLQPVPTSPPAFLASPLLTSATKFSVFRDAVGRSRPPSEDESIAALIRRKFTTELLEKLVGPFVSGIYAGDPETISARAAFPALHEAELSRGSLVRGMVSNSKSKPGARATLHTFKDGNQTLPRALAGSLSTAIRYRTTTHSVRLGSPATDSSRRPFQLQIRAVDGLLESITTDRLILATPADVAATLLRELNPTFESNLSNIPYAPVAVVSLGYRRSDVQNLLHGFGFLVPRSERLNILGTVWNSSLFPERTEQDQVLLTSFAGGATNPSLVVRDPEELSSIVHRELASVLGIREDPQFVRVTQWPRAIPQYNLGHLDRVTAVESAVHGVRNLRIIGNYLRGPAIGACIDHARAAAQDLSAADSNG